MPRRPTVVGLAPPPATGADPRRQPSPGSINVDVYDNTITAAAPRASLSRSLPLTVPSNVQIRAVDPPVEETDVTTLATEPNEPADEAEPLRAVKKADVEIPITEGSAARHASPVAKASVRPGVRVRSPQASAEGRPYAALPTLEADDADAGEGGDAYSAEESVTSREAARRYDDQSVTAMANMPSGPHMTRLGESPPVRVKEGMDGEEAESVTKRELGHLTNMLRVIATPNEVRRDDHTEVMPNAPVKPITGADSGLQIVLPDANAGERASVGALIAGAPAALPVCAPPMHAHPLGHEGARVAFPSAEGIHVPPVGPPHPSHHDVVASEAVAVKTPRYGLLVGLVAALSFVIPLALYLVLQRSSSDVAQRSASEVVPDHVGRADEKRTKAPKAPASTGPTQRTNHGGRSGGKRGR